MCGRLNVTDDKFVLGLLEQLGINLNVTPVQANRFVRAASPVQIVCQQGQTRQLKSALWWLLLDNTDSGFKPSKYTSFNTRYDKLNVPRSAGFMPFRESRCVIVARGFGETEFAYQGKRKVPKHYHDMIASDGAIAFGGLYKDYFNKITGEVKTGCSIITLPPHEKLTNIHSKSMPLMLPQDSHTLDAWLDPNNKQVDMFTHLLNPVIRHDLVVSQIDKPSHYQPIAESFNIEKDLQA